jgi:hypothetical protein
VIESRGQRGAWQVDGALACVRAARALCVLAVLAAVAVPLGFAPSALAAEEGQITGKVTDALTQAPIANIMVCMWPYAGTYRGEEYLGADQCEETGANGAYTLSWVPAGTYGVMFFVSELGTRTLDYALQYDGGGSSRSEGREVVVRRGETTSEINAAMRPGGHIMGVVTDASTQALIEGVEACTTALGGRGERGPALMVRCGVTNSSGEYMISALSTGEYVVEFDVPPEGPLDYTRLFYNGQTFAAGATLVPVTTGETTTGIDVAMQPGANITGRVTAAATGAALARIEVCAVSIVTGNKQNCRGTNVSGEYVLSQLPAGEYTIEFGGTLGYDENRGYALEYYGGKATLSESSLLSVTPGMTLSGIDAAMHEIEEEPPPVSEAPLSAGLVAATPVLTKTPVVIQTPVVTIMGSKLVVSGDSAPVRVACSQTTCQGSIELVVQTAARRGEGRRHQDKSALARNGRDRKTVVLATGSFSLAEGHSGSVLLHLTTVGRRRLADAKRQLLTARLVLSVKGGGTVSRVVGVDGS